MERIIIFGAGSIGKAAFGYFEGICEIDAFADNNSALWEGELFSRPIIPPDRIKEKNADRIIVASVHFREMARQLVRLGLERIFIFEIKKQSNGKDHYLIFPFEDFEFDDLTFSPIAHADIYRHGKKSSDRNRKALMIAYSFPPEGGAGVQRPAKFVKYLRDFGYEPIVLTSGIYDGVTSLTDESLLNDIPQDIRIIRIRNPYEYTSLYKKDCIQDMLDVIVKATGDEKTARAVFEAKKDNWMRILPDVRLLWEAECIRRIDEYIDMNEIDVLWTTVPSYSQHLLGACFKKKYGIPWVADYRDLWTTEEKYGALYTWYTAEDIKLQVPIEEAVVREADSIVVAGESWKNTFVDKLGIACGKITVITNGYDEEDFKGIELRDSGNSRFVLCYNGQMNHQCRNPRPVLTALNELIEERKINADHVCWVINGRIIDTFLLEIKENDRYGIIKSYGEIEHHACLESAVNSDLMVFMGESGEFGWLNYPGKFYEYLRIGRPILSLSGHNSFQERILSKTGLGKNFDFDEKDDIKSYILEQYHLWECEGKISQPCDEIVTRFERKTLTGRLAGLFDELLDNGES